MTGCWLFLKARPLQTMLGALCGQVAVLALLGDAVRLPLSQGAIPSYLVWGFTAAVLPTLVLESQVTSWERRSLRVLWPYELASWGVLVALAPVLAALVRHETPSPPATAVWLSALAVATWTYPVLGSTTWVVLVAIFTSTAFETGQSTSLILPLLTSKSASMVAVGAMGLAGAWITRIVGRHTA